MQPIRHVFQEAPATLLAPPTGVIWIQTHLMLMLNSCEIQLRQH